VKVVRGGDTSVTDFFASKTRAPLGEKFLPIVTAETEKVSLAAKYNAVASKGSTFGLIKPEDANVEQYVTRKALDGLLFMIGQEEKKIRADPVGHRQRDPEGRVRAGTENPRAVPRTGMVQADRPVSAVPSQSVRESSKISADGSETA